MKKALQWLGFSLTRILKGLILAAWILVLIVGAGLAASNNASTLLLNYLNLDYQYSYGYNFDSYSTDTYLSANEYLEDYLLFMKNPPPLASVLDQLVNDPSWTSADLDYSDFKGPVGPSGINKLRKDHYERLFEKVTATLYAMANPTSFGGKVDTINSDVVPSEFRGENFEVKDVPLPPEAKNWVLAERNRIESFKARTNLIDTFLLLMVLGAFGSLIFLTRDYMHIGESSSLASYFFRPVLGIFLAISMFILDMGAHFIFSNASILEIRHETLFVLALAAGLLADQAYTALEGRADTALDKIRAKLTGENTGQNNDAE